MRKTIVAGLMALSLAGCSTTQINQWLQFAQQVQVSASKACGVVPEINAIIAMFNAGIATTVGAITTAVCSLVPPPSSAKYKALPMVNSGPPAVIGQVGSVVVTGWRTR